MKTTIFLNNVELRAGEGLTKKCKKILESDTELFCNLSGEFVIAVVVIGFYAFVKIHRPAQCKG